MLWIDSQCGESWQSNCERGDAGRVEEAGRSLERCELTSTSATHRCSLKEVVTIDFAITQ
jgi:hypothetical protein